MPRHQVVDRVPQATRNERSYRSEMPGPTEIPRHSQSGP